MMLAVYLFLPIAVIGSFLIAAAIRATATEAARLGEAVDGMNRLQPALVEVRTESERTRQALDRLRRR